jgi:hypothetical protein
MPMEAVEGFRDRESSQERREGKARYPLAIALTEAKAFA